jgi:hypothetical protein
MKKLFILTVIFSLAFTICEQPTDDNSNPGNKLPSLTVRNQSSFVLTDVKFSNISFTVPNSDDLPVSGQSVKQLTANDVGKPYYLTFKRKDIGIICRTERSRAFIEDDTWTLTDEIIVEELGNTGNKNNLREITFLSTVTVEYDGRTVGKGDEISLGESVIDYTKQNSFVLKNTGVGKMLFDVNNPVRIEDAENVFSVIQPSSSTINPSSSLTFRIDFRPKAAQKYTATVAILSNDQSGNYVFTVTATGVPPRPIASVFYGDAEISQNGTIDAGEVIITLSRNITITLKNTGQLPLAVDTANITIAGADAAVFVKITNPGGNISAGGQSSFFIECKPVNQGENNAILTIPTNDEYRNPVVVLLKMTAVKGTAVPELSQDSTVISNNSITPFDFGRVELGTNTTQTFSIKNTGNIALELIGDIESSSPVFTITAQPPTNAISPLADTSFIIRYTPTTELEDTGKITITYNDNAQFVLNVKGTGYVKRPQISVFYEETEIPPNGTIDAEVLFTLSKNINVTVRNTGEAGLTIDAENTTITGTDEAAFIRTTSPVVSMQPGGQTLFTIRCTPDKVGEHNATLTIPSNDNFRSPFVINLKMTGVKGDAIPELSHDGTVIPNNSLTPIDFGLVELDSFQTYTFTIKNSGNIALELLGDPIVESSSSFFTITNQPANKTINPNLSTTFTVRYTPIAEVENTGAITIIYNEYAQFVFNLKGTGYIKRPQITIRQNNTTINQYGEYNFGRVAIDDPKDISFTIRNSGDANLTFVTVNNNRINLGENGEGLFSVIEQPSSSTVVTPGSLTTFTVRFNPVTEGNGFSATVLIETNSRTNSEFQFTVKADGYVKRPQITVRQSNTTINQYGEYDFGTVIVGGTKEITFTIENSGEANLTIESVNGKRINLTDNASGFFSVNIQPLSPLVAPGDSSTFSIKFTPTTAGNNYNTGVQIKTNSNINNEFVFRVKGNGSNTYKIGDTGPGGGIIFYAEGGQYKECSAELGSYTWNAAVSTASSYRGGGFSNWRLPDLGELSLMNTNLHQKGLGGFSNTNYWSLVEADSYYAWRRYFSSTGGYEATSSKSSSHYVRAIRAF